MGHLLNPLAFRLGFHKNWEDIYFIRNIYYSNFSHNLLKIRNYLYFFFNLKRIKKLGIILSNLNLIKFNSYIVLNLNIYFIDMIEKPYIIMSQFLEKLNRSIRNPKLKKIEGFYDFSKKYYEINNLDLLLFIYLYFFIYHKTIKNITKRIVYLKNNKWQDNKLLNKFIDKTMLSKFYLFKKYYLLDKYTKTKKNLKFLVFLNKKFLTVIFRSHYLYRVYLKEKKKEKKNIIWLNIWLDLIKTRYNLCLRYFERKFIICEYLNKFIKFIYFFKFMGKFTCISKNYKFLLDNFAKLKYNDLNIKIQNPYRHNKSQKIKSKIFIKMHFIHFLMYIFRKENFLKYNNSFDFQVKWLKVYKLLNIYKLYTFKKTAAKNLKEIYIFQENSEKDVSKEIKEDFLKNFEYISNFNLKNPLMINNFMIYLYSLIKSRVVDIELLAKLKIIEKLHIYNKINFPHWISIKEFYFVKILRPVMRLNYTKPFNFLLKYFKNILFIFLNINSYILNINFIGKTDCPAIFLCKYIGTRLKKNYKYYSVINPIKKILQQWNLYGDEKLKAYDLLNYNKILKYNKFLYKKTKYLNIKYFEKLYKLFYFVYYKNLKTLVYFQIILYHQNNYRKINNYKVSYKYFYYNMFYNRYLEFKNLNFKNFKDYIYYKNIYLNIWSNFYKYDIIFIKITNEINLKTLLVSTAFLKNMFNFIYYKKLWLSFNNANYRADRDDYKKKTQAALFGYKLSVKGRLSRKQRASSRWYQEGKLPLNTLNINIDYAFFTVPLKNSAVSIKLWLYKTPFINKYIETYKLIIN